MHAYRYFIVDLDNGSVTGTDDMPGRFCTWNRGVAVIDSYARLYYYNGDCNPIESDKSEDSDNG